MQIRNILWSLCTGGLLALAWPTYGFPLLLFIGFVPLLYVETRIREHKYHKSLIFGLAFLSFFVWNISTVWWLIKLPIGYVVWFATVVNAILMALLLLLYHIVARKTTFSLSTLFLVCLWMGFEYLHLHWEFSFPWLNLGNGFASFISWVQWYEYTGAFGGTLWVWVANISIFKGVLLYFEHKDKTILYRMALRNGLLIAIPIGISLLLLELYQENGDEVEVVVLQPNIDPYSEKYDLPNERIAEFLSALTDSAATANTRFIIAPETVFASNTQIRSFSHSSTKRGVLQLIEKYPNASFLGGISMIDTFRDSERITKQTNVIRDDFYVDDYNSAFFVRQDGSDELYHKTKLVVGAEHFPYKNLLKPILGDAMLDLGGTVLQKTTQENREVFYTNDSIGAGPIICYESIYGEFVGGYVRNGADFLTVITNDGWWGNTQGHKQHLSFSKLRAVETRRSVVRSANTGISAVINQKGVLVDQLGYEKKGALRRNIRLNTTMTFYVRYGNYIPRIAIFLGILVLLYVFTIRRGQVRID